MKKIISALFGVAILQTASATALDASLIQTSGQPSVAAGKFYGYRSPDEGPGDLAFSNAFFKARSERVPLVVVWSHETCHYCDDFITSLNGAKKNVSAWLSDNRAVFSFFKATGYSSAVHSASTASAGPGITEPKACLDAWSFSQACGSKYIWPLISFYYEKADGSVVKWGYTSDSGGKDFTWLKTQYESWCEKNHIGRYPTGTFAVTGTEFDRYEAEPTTRYVDVELVRTAEYGTFAATNALAAFWPGENGPYLTTNVAWSVGETSRWVRVSLVRGLPFPADGIEIELKLADGYGNLVATTPVVCRTALANSVENPYWKTERTPETLAFGEWTCDLDTATNKVAAFAAEAKTNAWTLVYAHGSLWCPYCYLNGPSFVKTAAFRDWALSNNVALVSADMPHNSNDKPDVDYGTIWHRKTDYTNLYFDGNGMVARSGNGYLSRKMVSEEEAAEVRAEHRYWSREFFHLPEDYQTDRAMIPGMMLLDASGRLVGRFETFDYDMNMHTNGENAVVYCRRLSEMLRTALTAPERTSEILNDCCRTTPIALSAFPSSEAPTCVTGLVSHADYRDVRRLKDVSPGLQAVYTLKGDRAAQVRLCLIEDRHGAIPELVTTVTGILSEGLTLDTSSIPGFLFEDGVDYYVRVSCHSFWPNDPYHKADPTYKTYRLRWGDGDDGFSRDFRSDCEGDTVTEYELSATPLCIPQEKYLTLDVPKLAAFHLNVEEDETYRLTGISTPSADDFEPEGGDFYRARVTGAVRLEPAGFGGVVGYQLWHPGTVSFATAAERVIEYAGTGTVSVVRADGGSNAETVTVRCVAHDLSAEGRYAWTDQKLVWEDGERGAKEVGFALFGNETYEQDATFTLALSHPADSPATLIAPLTNVVTICDTDAPCLEKSSYSVSAVRSFSTPGLAFPVINVREGGRITVKRASGSAALPSGMSVKYDAASGQVVLTGVPTKAGTYTFEVVVSECRRKGVATGFSTTITVTVAEPADTNEYAAKARPSQKLAFYETDGFGQDRLVGLLDVAITSKGRISAKYAGTETKTVSFSGTWATFDGFGRARTTLTGKDGSVLNLTLDRSGTLSAALDSTQYGNLSAVADWPETGVFDAYRGYYTAVLATNGVQMTNLAQGSAYLSLTMTSAASVRSGTVRYAGVLPDGAAVSGSVVLRNRTETAAELPVFYRSSRNVLGAAISLGADGALNWAAENANLREVVVPSGGTAPYVWHRDQNPDFDYVSDCEAAGVWYQPGIAPATLFDLFYGKYGSGTPFVLRIGEEERGVVRVKGTRLVLDRTSGLSFSFVPRTGVFSGTATLTVGGRRVSGQYRGAVIPGWINSCECGFTAPERPFGGGTFYYRDTVGGKACTRSLPVVLDVERP